MNVIAKSFLASIFILFISSGVYSQERKFGFGFDYETEVQTNFSGKYNWVNLLTINANYSPWENGRFDLQTISNYKTSKDRIAGDLQVFSNIESDNLPLNIFLAGYTHQFKKLTVFGGLRNINNDYFTEEYTSVFTNSSCGIYPTISEKYSIANYPYSGLCLHAEYKFSDRFMVQSSLYNGVAHQVFTEHGRSAFNIDPEGDGIFTISEACYTPSSDRYSFYGLGVAVHSASWKPNEAGEYNHHVDYTLWGSSEQRVYKAGKKEIGLLFQYSFSPYDPGDCGRYKGFGVIMKSFIPAKHQNYIAAVVTRANYSNATETALEVTCAYQLTERLLLQPVYDYIVTGDKTYNIGMLRLAYSFGN